MKSRILLLCLVVLGLIALSVHAPRVRAEDQDSHIHNPHIVYRVPVAWGHLVQMMNNAGDYYGIFEAPDGTVRMVKLQTALGDPYAFVEIQRK